MINSPSFPSKSSLRRLHALPLLSACVMANVAGAAWCQGVLAGGPPSWIFRQSQYSHDPATGARVAQYSRVRPVEPLPDPRQVTSGYRRVRTNLRGPDGSADSYYSVSSYGNGRGGLDAEWERFHDAWLQSFTAGGQFLDARLRLGPGHPFQPGFGWSPYGQPQPFFPPFYGAPQQHHPPAGSAPPLPDSVPAE